MPSLPTVVLEHVTPQGRHHDWLIQPPAWTDLPGLVTFRVAPSPHQWSPYDRLLLTPLPPHRAAYLTYQGPLTQGRGHVTRRAAGHVIAWQWTAQRIVLDVRLSCFEGTACLSPVRTDVHGLWQVVFSRGSGC